MRMAPAARLVLCVMFLFVVCPALQAQRAPANETGTQFYMRYLAAFTKATKFDDILPFMSAERVKEANAMPAEQRADMLEFVKMMAPTNVKITNEKAAGAGATLTATAVDSDKSPQYGTIDLVKEGGAWKISKESWTNQAPR